MSEFTPQHGSRWKAAEARAKFSQVVRQAEAGTPQFITLHDQTVVVVGMEQWNAAISRRLERSELHKPEPGTES